jgi:RimJ/RimL family protein N-acetyltransferase
MKVRVTKTELKEVESLREMFLQENNLQFVHNKCHQYGWADIYIFHIDDIVAGYGSVWGTDKREDRDAVFEFYTKLPFRKFADSIFMEFSEVSKAIYIQCQTNEKELPAMLYRYCKNINAEAILFEDHYSTSFFSHDVIFSRKLIEQSSTSDMGGFMLEQDGEVVATGGLMLNYNFPYADIYMEVKEDFRQKGYGTLIVQELKRVAYEANRIPSARCNINNQVSKSTLTKAGFRNCGFLVKGEIKKD